MSTYDHLAEAIPAASEQEVAQFIVREYKLGVSRKILKRSLTSHHQTIDRVAEAKHHVKRSILEAVSPHIDVETQTDRRTGDILVSGTLSLPYIRNQVIADLESQAAHDRSQRQWYRGEIRKLESTIQLLTRPWYKKLWGWLRSLE